MNEEGEKRDPATPPDPRAALLGGGCFSSVLLAVSLGWLAWRDRLSMLPQQAIGQHGVLVGAAVGLAVGLAGATATAALSRRFAALREIEARAALPFADMPDAGLLAFVLVGAVAEEIFFRLAVQDAIGLAGSVAVYVLLSISAGRALLLPAAAHALCLGALVHFGFGLFASSTAHAVLNYLSLRRILCR